MLLQTPYVNIKLKDNCGERWQNKRMEYSFSTKISGLKPSIIREILKNSSVPGLVPFSAGNPAAESFPVAEMAQISADIFANRAVSALQYSITEGYTPLREKIKKRLFEKFAIGTEEDDLIITSGGQQVIDLTCKVLCNEGDVVVSEDPAFIGALNAFRAYNTKLVGVPMENDGVDLAKLEETFRTNEKVKLFYTIPSFQNPLGICTSLEKRKGIYELCKKYGIIILEDNPYGELRFEGEDIPTIKSMDTEGIVVYAGSLSKIFSAGMRVGFVCAPEPIISKITVAKQTNDVHTNIFFQMLVDEYFEKYDLNTHIDNIKKIYKRKSALMLRCMDEAFPKNVFYTRPQGGLFLWCEMPEGNDALLLAKAAMEKKVAIVPGNAFAITEGTQSHAFRLNYSTPSDEDIERGITVLAGCLKEFVK